MKPPDANERPAKARYLMIGGFLGAGKTTTVGALARYLVARGQRVGLITNDQAGGLVDTKLLRSQGFPTEEIAGGCFCCRFNTLVEAAGRLTRENAPDVFVAEPVGSCTDLVATVTYPLRRMYGEAFAIGPLSVLVDPIRAMRVFGLAGGGGFSPKVTYIYKKQIEEADIIVLSKSDLISPPQEQQLRGVLARNYPKARILAASSRHGVGLDPWFQCLLAEESPKYQLMTLDYDVYAEGEAQLGWLNATLRIDSASEFDANGVLSSFAQGLQNRLRSAGAEVAHLKMTFSPDDSLAGEIASIHCVRNDSPPEMGMELEGPVRGGQWIVNLRAESNPSAMFEFLQAEIAATITSNPGFSIQVEHVEHFRPGRPEPTYRDGVEVPGPGSACCTPDARKQAARDGVPYC